MAFQGHCARHVNASLLQQQQCPYSCALCNNYYRSNKDDDDDDDQQQQQQQQQRHKVRIFYGKDQDAAEPETVEHIRSMQEYMVHTVFADNNKSFNYKQVRAECKNRHAECSYWATIGECQQNPRFMQM